MFSLDPLDVGNPAMLGLMEEINLDCATAAYAALRQQDDGHLTVADIDNCLAYYNVDYPSLPRYAKRWFDSFNLAEE